MQPKYLLDTQILIWLAQDPDKISLSAKAILASESTLLLSFVSIWEMAIKVKTGKLILGQLLNAFINAAISKYEIELLPISLNHLYKIQELELHHRDPFDRLLVAQSIVDD